MKQGAKEDSKNNIPALMLNACGAENFVQQLLSLNVLVTN